MNKVTSILIRMPNWLGDMVMASSFVKAVQEEFPDAAIDLIVKKGLDFLPDHFHPSGKKYIFSKEEYPGLAGAGRFGKEIRRQKKYDLFFCLPDSFSSAVMSSATGANKKIGFRKGFRFIFFTKTFRRKKDVHRAVEYLGLLGDFLQKRIRYPQAKLFSTATEKTNALVININSEASSRRLPKEKAVSVINYIRKQTGDEIILVGSPAEKEFVDDVYRALDNKDHIKNIAGQTTLPELINVFATAKAVLSTDSGPAHIANALGTPTAVLFGAGNENNTAPFNLNNRKIVRLGKLSCEPCTDNICKRYGTPECLLQLDEQIIYSALKEVISSAAWETDLHKCVETMQHGGTILYPTDTVWGIGCDARNEKAVAEIYALKKRDEKKSMIILLDDYDRISDYADEPSEHIINLMDQSDKPVTVIFSGAKNLPANLINEDGTIAIRIVWDHFCKMLVTFLDGPIVSTSANISGETSPQQFSEISDEIKSGVDYVVKQRQDENKQSSPSRIIKWVDDNHITVIRD